MIDDYVNLQIEELYKKMSFNTFTLNKQEDLKLIIIYVNNVHD